MKSLNFKRIIFYHFFLITILLIVFLWRSFSLPPQLPLLFSLPEGEEQIVDSYLIFLLPFSSSFLVFLNFYLVKKIFSQEKFILAIVYILNLLISSLAFFFFVKIIFLVT